MNRSWLAIFLAIAAMVATRTAGAFCAMPPPKLCNAYFRAAVVVSGKVLSEQSDPDWIRYKIRVGRTFKGEQLSVRTFYTAKESGRLSLDVGREYVLFATRSNDRLLIGCNEQSLSRDNIAVISAGIQFLRASKSTVATIEGQIVSASNFGSPLSGVSVIATGSGGVYRMVSTSEGLFSARVPPGQYRVDVDPSVAQQTIFNVGYTNPKSIHLAAGQCVQLQYQGVRR
jgi:hypothetical protein